MTQIQKMHTPLVAKNQTSALTKRFFMASFNGVFIGAAG